MKERFLNVSEDAGQKQEEQFNTWLLGESIPFADNNAAAAYRERVSLIEDAIQLKKIPSRIPICPSAGFFPIQYAGASMYDAMYDYEILTTAWKKYCDDLPRMRTTLPRPWFPENHWTFWILNYVNGRVAGFPNTRNTSMWKRSI